MADNNARFFFALLIGLSVGFLAGFLTATQLEQSRLSGAAGSGSMSTGSPAQQAKSDPALPEGHPPVDFQKELDALQQVLKNNPQDFTALSQMGNIYYDMGRYNDAIPWYEKALQIHPDDPGVRTDMGTCLHYVGQHKRALQEFEAVLAKNPNFAHALHNLGIVKQVGLGDSKGAIEAWEKLLATNPDYPAAAQVRENLAKLKAGKPL